MLPPRSPARFPTNVHPQKPLTKGHHAKHYLSLNRTQMEQLPRPCTLLSCLHSTLATYSSPQSAE